MLSAQGYLTACLVKGNHRALSGAPTNADLKKHFICAADVHLAALKVLVYSFVLFGVFTQYSTGSAATATATSAPAAATTAAPAAATTEAPAAATTATSAATTKSFEYTHTISQHLLFYDGHRVDDKGHVVIERK